MMAKSARLQLVKRVFDQEYNWSWQEVRMLVKQGLVGVRNVCIVRRGDLEIIRLQLAVASRYCLENGW